MDVKKAIWKVHFKILVIYFCSICIFGVSSWFLIKKIVSYREAKTAMQSLRSDEIKIAALEKFAQDVQRYKVSLDRITSPREVSIEEQILMEPLDNFFKKLSDIYSEHGFFFIESMNITTCIEIKDMKLSRQPNCSPVASIKGRKVYFTYEAF